MTSRRFNVVDGLGLQTHARDARWLGVHRERVVVGWRAGRPWGAPNGLWDTFSEWAAFQRGKKAEKQAENRDFREGNYSQKTSKLAHFGPAWPTG